jgi:hypothetical protein
VKRRAVFWVVFLLLAGGMFAFAWKTNDPLRNNPYLAPLWVRYQLRLLAHPHPAVAHDAWLTLWNLYYTKWTVYEMFPKEVGDTTPISFLIERQSFPASGDQPAVAGFFAVNRPIYYTSERVHCRTVGEALMAIMYREKKWPVDYEGDWKAWWQANRTLFP